MKIEKGIAICTRPSIIRSLQSKMDNELILNACDDLLENFLKSIDDYMVKYDKNEKGKRETGALITFMNDFEKRYVENQKTMEDKMNAMTNSVNEKISAQLLTLMTSFDKTISATLNENMKKWLMDDMRNLETNISNHIQDTIKEPIENLLKNYNGSSGSLINSLKDVENKVNNMIQNTMEKLQESKELSLTQKQNIVEHINNIPSISKGVFSELIMNIERKTHELDSIVSSNSAQLSNMQISIRDNASTMAVIKDHTQQILSKTSKDMYSNSVKATESQNTVYNLLKRNLSPMDGYEVGQTHAITNAMDITVKKINYSPIKIDVKNHSYTVKKAEVDKFKKDMEINSGCSGILLSLETDIAEHADLEIEQLPHGKFAVYIGNNRYNIQIVIDAIRLIHRLEQLLSKSEDADCVTLTPEKMYKIQSHLKEFSSQIQTLRSHLNQSINILDEMKLDGINKIVNQKDETITTFQCNKCLKTFKKSQGLAMHIKKCGQKDDAKEEDILVESPHVIEDIENEIIDPLVPLMKTDNVEKIDESFDLTTEQDEKSKKQKRKKIAKVEEVKKLVVIDELIPIKEEVIAPVIVKKNSKEDLNLPFSETEAVDIAPVQVPLVIDEKKKKKKDVLLLRSSLAKKAIEYDDEDIPDYSDIINKK